MGTVHVVGAGVAGLAAAVHLAPGPDRVVLHEAAQQAGGRCRSYHDRQLGCRIDNGNHLVLSGNRAACRYLETIGAADSLSGPEAALYPFVDLGTGERWTLRWERGRIPWWLLRPARRVPGTRLGSYLAAGRLSRAPPDATIGDVLDPADPLFVRLIDPLARAVLNTPPAAASAALLGVVLRETFGRGASACRPLVARGGLSESCVDPALAWLRRQGVEVRFGARLNRIDAADGRARRLAFGVGPVDLAPGDAVILALPAGQAADLLPGLVTPTRHHAIVNGHFRAGREVRLPGGAVLLGIVGGTAEWIFARGRTVSVTVSAADALADRPADEIAPRLWADVARALDLAVAPLPPARIVKERRATFAQTPDQVARRPGPTTRLRNLVLAGDWTDTGLPATIEGAIRSGERAAALALTILQPQVAELVVEQPGVQWRV